MQKILVDLNNEINFTDDDNLYALCHNKVYRLNPIFYSNSKYCRKVCLQMSDEQLYKYTNNDNNFKFNSFNYVLVLNETIEPESLVSDYIRDIQHFYNFIISADIMNLNLEHMQKLSVLRGFLNDLRNEYKSQWKLNKEILSNTDTYRYTKRRFIEEPINFMGNPEYILKADKKTKVSKGVEVINIKTDSNMLTQDE